MDGVVDGAGVPLGVRLYSASPPEVRLAEETLQTIRVGRRHARENLVQVLSERLSPPLRICDALSRNLPKKLETIVGYCNAHARRRSVDLMPNFPEECRYGLESFAEGYQYDVQAQEQGLSPEERLRFHEEHSAPGDGEAARLALCPV